MCQGWYGTGFGYGVWVGVLMASGYKVVPVRAQAWKSAMGISGREYTKVCQSALLFNIKLEETAFSPFMSPATKNRLL